MSKTFDFEIESISFDVEHQWFWYRKPLILMSITFDDDAADDAEDDADDDADDDENDDDDDDDDVTTTTTNTIPQRHCLAWIASTLLCLQWSQVGWFWGRNQQIKIEVDKCWQVEETL